MADFVFSKGFWVTCDILRMKEGDFVQKEIRQKGDVLNHEGVITPGYSTHEYLRYSRAMVKAKPFRLKEWDFYQIEDEHGRFVLQLTYGHASYIGQIGVMMFDVARQEWLINESVLIPMATKRMNLPESAQENHEIVYEKGDFKVHFQCLNGQRSLRFQSPHFTCALHLQPLIDDVLVINIPFDDSPQHFYYNYKQNCMQVTGTITYAIDHIWHAKTLDDCRYYAILDWGRGVWPFHNEWFWSNGQGMVEGQLFGFNLGCGFGNTSAATENIFFYDNKPHKLGQVTITHEENFMAPWTLRDEEGRCDLRMIPEFDRITKDKILFVDNCTHQVFGRFYGTVTLDDERRLMVDGLPAFAEHAVNNW